VIPARVHGDQGGLFALVCRRFEERAVGSHAILRTDVHEPRFVSGLGLGVGEWHDTRQCQDSRA
jgi:hypothetical protein